MIISALRAVKYTILEMHTSQVYTSAILEWKRQVLPLQILTSRTRSVRHAHLVAAPRKGKPQHKYVIVIRKRLGQ